MKNLTKILMAVIAVGLTACGTANNPQTGYYNQSGQWIPTNGTNYYGGSTCITSTSQQISLSFTAQNVDFNGNAGLYAGNLPAGHPMQGAHGTVTLSGGMIQQMGGSIMLQKQSQAGSIQMSVNPSARSASGQIMITPQALYNTGIMNFLYSGYNNYGSYPQTGYPQTGYPSQSLCVTNIALDVVYTASTGYYSTTSNGYINSALVYLYLSNGQIVPMPVQFY